MNFQSVSVGQKLVDPERSCVRSSNAPGCDPSHVSGGYEPGTLDFTPQLEGAMGFVDRSLGAMARALLSHRLAGSTEIVVTAKHGQSPIDPSKLAKVGDAISPILSAAGVRAAQLTEDDVALIWLEDQSQTGTAVAALNGDRTGTNTARIQTVLSGAALAAQFNSPARDPRTPDIIVEPVPGTIYTSSKAKVAEHGGFSEDDTHVALLVVNPSAIAAGGLARTVSTTVHTTQVAPTILRYLGLDPSALDAVRLEGTQALPAR
jgi:arylsulfatase A-like enzyme